MLKNIIKRCLSTVGYKLSKLPGRNGAATPLFDTYSINTVFDIGANIGQFAMSLRQDGYKGRIISFEAAPEAHEILKLNARRDNLWVVPENVAITNFDGTTTFYQSHNLVSSSLKKPTALTTEPCAESGVQKSFNVPASRLDKLFSVFVSEKSKIMLKIDVQGAEIDVLQGATNLIQSALVIQLEMNIVYLYEGSALYFEVDTFLRDRNFKLVGLLPGFKNYKTGHLLQYDAIYAR